MMRRKLLSVTRRQFLRRSLYAAGTAAAAPYFVPAGVLAASGNPAPSDRIGVAYIGVGRRGNQLMNLPPSGRIVAVADVDPTRAAGTATARKCRAHADYRHLLDAPDVDAVIVATPDHWHALPSTLACQAGKDVYCEKPLTLTIGEGRILCRVAKETGAVFQVGTQQRTEFDDVFLKAAAIVRSGRLGETIKALSSVGQPDFVRAGGSRGPFQSSPPPEGLDWDLWLGQAPWAEYCPERYFYDWRWWFAYSGGQVTDWGVHHTDIAVWAMGLDGTGPVSIEGKATFPGVEGGFDVAESFDCTLKYADGQEIRLFSGANELIFSGEKGRIRVNRGGLTGRPVEELTEKDNEELAGVMAQLCRGKQPGGHMKNFFECVRDRSLPVSDVYSHHRAVSCCHLANIALRLDRPLAWDPEKEDFVGDAQASALLSRPQRKPYDLT